MTKKTQALKATFYIGNINFRTYEIDNGQRFVPISDVAAAIGVTPEELGKLRNALDYRDSITKGLPAPSVMNDVVYGQFFIIRLEDVMKYWMLSMTNGNTRAAILLGACQFEALEFRADFAYGMAKSLADRNYRITKTLKTAPVELTWIQEVNCFVSKNPKLTRLDQEWLWMTLDNITYVFVFGLTPAMMKQQLGLAEFDCLRSSLDDADKTVLLNLETLAIARLKKGMHPIAALLSTIEHQKPHPRKLAME